MEYYSDIFILESLPLVATWMDLEGIKLSGKDQRGKHTPGSHLYVKSKEAES